MTTWRSLRCWTLAVLSWASSRTIGDNATLDAVHPDIAGVPEVAKIFSGAFTYASFVMIAKAASFGKEIVIASIFGAGAPLDTYLIGLIVPAFMINVVSVSLSFVLVPRYLTIRANSGNESARQYLSAAMAALIVVHLVLLPPTLVAAFLLDPIFAAHLPVGDHRLVIELTAVLVPMFLFGGLRATWGMILEAERRFGTSALLQVVTPLTIALVLLALPHSVSIWALATATTVGSLLEAALAAWAIRRLGLPSFGWPPLRATMADFLRASLPIIMGAVIMSSSAAIDQAMAANLGPANLSTYGFGIRITGAVLTLAVSIGTVAFPYFSSHVGNHDWGKLRRVFLITLLVVLAGGCVIALLLSGLAHPLVVILFERGSFSPGAAIGTAAVQRWYSLQIPFYAASIVAIRLLIASGRNDIVLALAAIALVSKVACNLWLSKIFGVVGIAAAAPIVTAVITIAYVVASLQMLARRESAANLASRAR
jgi:putative peptidoglycan lipid II flippase